MQAALIPGANIGQQAFYLFFLYFAIRGAISLNSNLIQDFCEVIDFFKTASIEKLIGIATFIFGFWCYGQLLVM